ncbi:LysR family transcriptional regulator [Celerinatantimonas yamalensis]|uniref:LysR family transcriptional regulator n=1 Tax=Celerinatantimonas yamalensis TaxID=559956 RepID=A0ABW9G980_9GAMM
MNQLKLRHLHAFVTVVDAGNMSRAAEQLFMQQPSLSRLLQSLEKVFDTPLLTRLPRGVEATAAGLALYEQAQIILSKVAKLPSTVQHAASGLSGELAVGFTSSAALAVPVMALLNHYREQFANVQMRLEEAGSGELVSSLLTEQLDAAFIRSVSPSNSERLTLFPVSQESMLVALPARHHLAHLNTPMALGELAQEPFVLYRRPSGPGLYDSILAACYQAGFSPEIVQEAPRLTTMMSLVAAGLGVSIVPQSLKRLEAIGVVYRPLDAQVPLFASIWLAVRAGSRSPRLENLCRMLKPVSLDDWPNG